MASINFLNKLKILTTNFKSCSVVNAQGQLLFSKDEGNVQLCTTRLVAFQIVKRYLQPKARDLFILNDPENGGFQFDHPLFISGLTGNLYLIWDEPFSYIDFKIPPTPLYEGGARNEFIWKALVNSQSFSKDFEIFIDNQKDKTDRIARLSEMLTEVSLERNQVQWLKNAQAAFERLFAIKAAGTAECHIKLPQSQMIKIKLTCEEKLNLRQITVDLSNTSLAQNICASSHVIESALIKHLVQFYDLQNHFTQPLLDRIKIIVPPRSIVSKAHPAGAYNIDLQYICENMISHNLNLINTPSRKAGQLFQQKDILYFNLCKPGHKSAHKSFVTNKMFSLPCIEKLISLNQIKVTRFKRGDLNGQLSFNVLAEDGLKLQFFNQLSSSPSQITLKLNDQIVQPKIEPVILKQNDEIHLDWNY